MQGHTTIVPVATLSRALLQDTASSGSTLSSTNDSKEAITDSTAASYASSDTTDAVGVTIVSGASDEDQSPLKAYSKPYLLLSYQWDCGCALQSSVLRHASIHGAGRKTMTVRKSLFLHECRGKRQPGWLREAWIMGRGWCGKDPLGRGITRPFVHTPAPTACPVPRYPPLRAPLLHMYPLPAKYKIEQQKSAGPARTL